MNPEWKSLEQTMIELVREHYRLLGCVVYETLDPEIEALIIGGE